MIWSKAFVMERERYDGADVAHLLHACAERDRLGAPDPALRRHWRVLLQPPRRCSASSIRPSATRIPACVMRRAAARAASARCAAPPARRICPGHADLARAVPRRRRALGLRGRAPRAPRQHDRGRRVDLDGGDRRGGEPADRRAPARGVAPDDLPKGGTPMARCDVCGNPRYRYRIVAPLLRSRRVRALPVPCHRPRVDHGDRIFCCARGNGGGWRAQTHAQRALLLGGWAPSGRATSDVRLEGTGPATPPAHPSDPSNPAGHSTEPCTICIA